ncbi:tripartite tricarboxylate transporter substrate binding protein [Pseudaquabacterium rugosum]|jgi:putative tricarboxylic transport membrane protein|uniref:Tripartite tricarboxylate transporter substrate binding protein n=1 Tax=Pseudaquabacterium rugosum TaxID=2984194 RepID=A0ABU9BF25_9BURK
MNQPAAFNRRATLGYLAAAAALVLARPAGANTPVPDSLKFTVPGSPGGGYDQTARTLAKALQAAARIRNVSFENKNGAGGTLGLAQFVNGSAGEAGALCVMGAIMVTGVVQNKPPVTLAQTTPVARLFTEYNVIAVRKDAPWRSMAELLQAFKAEPTRITWGGGSKGSVDHIGISQLAAATGVPLNRLNYIPFGGGGEVVAATLGGHVSAITGGYAELASYVKSGQFRVLAVGAPQRLKGIDAPTLKELGLDLEIGNWRGVVAAGGLSPAQQQAWVSAIEQAVRTPVWQDALLANHWTPSLLTGAAFGHFIDSEHARLRAMLVRAGLL